MKQFKRTNHIFGGVCGGLGDYFNIDPIFFRIGAMFCFLFSPLMFIVYLVVCSISESNE
jgi:phage shock protein PspC (stress-responsive transcriptional regulator)